VVCLVGAGWALHSHGSASESKDKHAEDSSGKRSTPVTVALGQADVEGGVLSLSPTMPGRVAAVPVAENEEVRAGAVLLRLDGEAARAQVEEAEAALTAAEAELAEARKGPRQHQLRLAQQKAAAS